MHLLVDGICSCGVMMLSSQIISDTGSYAIIVLYDILAFGTQPLTGRWVDERDAGSHKLKLTIVLLASGTLVSTIPTSMTILTVISGAILLGMGNSLFHVYGGKYVAVASQNDIRAMGIYVSTGAVGLAIGLGFSSPMLLAIFVFSFIALSVLHLHMADGQKATARQEALSFVGIDAKPSFVRQRSAVPALYLSCLMLVVAGRGCIGESLPTLHISLPSVSTPLMMVIVSAIVMLGKAAGGFMSKWWGVRKLFVSSMLLGATSFLMSPLHEVFVLSTLLLINLSMPCTLFLATKAVPEREGWTFGLLAMALLPGYLLGYLAKDRADCQALLVPLIATILLESLLLLFMRERRWQVLAVSVVLNIFTNVPLNFFIMTYDITSPLYLFGLECVVVMVEFWGFWFVIHDKFKAFKYSFLCNSFSALAGFLFQTLWYYTNSFPSS